MEGGKPAEKGAAMIMVLLVVFVVVAVVLLWYLYDAFERDTPRTTHDGGDDVAAASSPNAPPLTEALRLDSTTGPMLDATTGHTPLHAHYLGKACDLAYKTAEIGRALYREQLNLDATLASVDNTQAWVGQNAGSIVVAFRGSEFPGSLDGFKDWLLTNARNFLVVPEGRIGTDFVAAGVGARFHRGFMSALDEIWEPLYAEVDQAMRTKERPLWITGHSLGGAIALLCAWRLQQRFLQVHQICTFGAPMIGNVAAAEAYHREFPGRVFRYVDAGDMVPRLPMISMFSNPYGHCETEVIVGGEEMSSSPQGVASIPSATQQPSQSQADGETDEDVAPLNAKAIDGIWGNLNSGISSHLMDNYLARISDRLA